MRLYAQRVFAAALDLALCWFFFCVLIAASGTLPVPRPSWLAAFAALTALYWALFRFTLGRTLGQAALRAKPGLRGVIFLSASFLFAVLFGTSLGILQHPIWKSVPEQELDAYLPPLNETRPIRWSVAPFFYALGAWPVAFDGNPVFLVFPYEKGPPNRFAGRMVARWDSPHAEVTYEGPKTPPSAADRVLLRRCITDFSWLSCQTVREAALSRHFEEISRIGKQLRWEVSWFRIKNGSIPASEQAQGIFISASNQERGQDRYIVITPKGIHQAFILNYAKSDSGLLARETFQNSIRSLRVTDELNLNRAWIDRRLESVRLNEVSANSQPEQALAQLAEIEFLLLSKISTDPATYDTYFHLGGVGTLLSKIAKRSNDHARASEWSAIARPMLESASLYAKDVSPSESRNTLLENMLIDAQKGPR